MPLFFWFDLILEARAEILEKISLVIRKKFGRQKGILKLTDLYKVTMKFQIRFIFGGWEKIGNRHSGWGSGVKSKKEILAGTSLAGF